MIANTISAATISTSTVSASTVSSAVVSPSVSPTNSVSKSVAVSPASQGVARRLTFNQILSRAMHNPDEWVIRLRYVGKNGVTTERVVSPIKMVGPTSLLALCLCREEPRRFELGRCSHIELLNANDVLMPVEIRVIAQAPSIPASSALAPNALTTSVLATGVKIPVAVPNAMPLTAELVAV